MHMYYCRMSGGFSSITVSNKQEKEEEEEDEETMCSCAWK